MSVWAFDVPIFNTVFVKRLATTVLIDGGCRGCGNNLGRYRLRPVRVFSYDLYRRFLKAKIAVFIALLWVTIFLSPLPDCWNNLY